MEQQATVESIETLELLEAAAKAKRERRMDFFKPYAKQAKFIALGATKRERLLKAGNQQGKSECGAFESSCHLTGIYPAWWQGKRFNRPVRGWAAGESATVVRDVQQKKLCGEPGVDEAWGTGMIPKECLIGKSMSRSATDAYDTLQIRHISGGVSTLKFKSYEQGRTKFQGDSVDFIWDDEEPPDDVHSECLARITATGGMLFITFTALKGSTAVVDRFEKEESPDRAMVIMGIDDIAREPHGHIKPEDVQKIVSGYKPWEREARAHGGTLLGSGRVYTTLMEQLKEPQIREIPIYWRKLWGIDFGWNHPFAAVLLLWDTDNDIVHVHHTIRMVESLPITQAQAMLRIGAQVPVAWPHDGDNTEKGSGEPLVKEYRDCKLLMLGERASHPSGGNSVAAGVDIIQNRMSTGRLKVADHLSEWFEEYMTYHRKDGLIVKQKDDLMDSTRCGIMMLRFARAVPLGPVARSRQRQHIADGVDFDLE